MSNIKLSTRQMQMLQSMANGERNKITAHKIGIAYNTVHTHWKEVRRKLNANSAAHAVAIAFREGIIK